MSEQTDVNLTPAEVLIRDISVEVSGADAPQLSVPGRHLVPGRSVNVTYLGTESTAQRLTAARTVRESGMIPVPHISARRVESQAELTEFLAALQQVEASGSVFVVGGDPKSPRGPYADSLAVVASGLLEEHGVGRVGFAGYPEGHPSISDDVLWRALRDNLAEATTRGLSASLVTQFGFDPDPVLTWVERVRESGFAGTIRVGVPGPVGVKRLLGYATRFGVGNSSKQLKRYGLSLTNLTRSVGPDRFVRALADGYDCELHGDLRLHLFTFGGLIASSRWIEDFAAAMADS